jgi:hypothetical protein
VAERVRSKLVPSFGFELAHDELGDAYRRASPCTQQRTACRHAWQRSRELECVCFFVERNAFGEHADSGRVGAA